MAVTPISFIVPAPSARALSTASSSADAHGFGGMLDGGASAAANGGATAGGGPSDAPKPAPTSQAAGSNPDQKNGASSGPPHANDASSGSPGTNGDAGSAKPADGTDVSKAAADKPTGSDKSTTSGKGRGKDHDHKDGSDNTTGLIVDGPGITATAVVTQPVVGAAPTGAVAADTTQASAAANATPMTGAQPGAPTQTLGDAAPLPATGAALPLPAATDAGATAGSTASATDPLAAAAMAALAAGGAPGSAKSPLTGGQAPGTAANPTGQAGFQAAVDQIGAQSSSNAPLPSTAQGAATSAGPLPSIPAGPVPPTSAEAAALLSQAASASAGAVTVQSQPRATAGTLGVSLRDAKSNLAVGAQSAGALAGSFGNAALVATSVTSLAAALLGGSGEQIAQFAESLAHAGTAAAEAVKPSGDKATAEAMHGAASATSVGSGDSFASLLNGTAPSQATNQAPAAPTALPQPLVPLPHLPALQIMPALTKAASEGGGRFNIQLHPADLGRVRIDLDIDHDGNVTASISAAHPETLDLLRRDASSLQQALTDAGLKSDGNSLSFNLQGDGQRGSDGSGRSGSAPTVPPSDDPLADEPAPQTTATSHGAGLAALDVRI